MAVVVVTDGSELLITRDRRFLLLVERGSVLGPCGWFSLDLEVDDESESRWRLFIDNDWLKGRLFLSWDGLGLNIGDISIFHQGGRAKINVVSRFVTKVNLRLSSGPEMSAAVCT